jgi:hypothetical protein
MLPVCYEVKRMNLRDLTKAVREELKKEGLSDAWYEAVRFHGKAGAVEQRIYIPPSYNLEQRTKFLNIVGNNFTRFTSETESTR